MNVAQPWRRSCNRSPGWLADLDRKLARPRFAGSHQAASLREHIRYFQQGRTADREGAPMSLPTQMTNHWQHRDEPGTGEGTVYWHMLMGDYPEVTSLARQAQQQLAPFATGLHMTPLNLLHMTTLVAARPAASLTSSSSR
jgi:hypothetical protein